MLYKSMDKYSVVEAQLERDHWLSIAVEIYPILGKKVEEYFCRCVMRCWLLYDHGVLRFCDFRDEFLDILYSAWLDCDLEKEKGV